VETPLVYVIGDSISMGYGPFLQALIEPDFRYSRKTGEEEALQQAGIQDGANGGDSSMVLAFLNTLDAWGAFKADILLVNCGLHDIKADPATGALQVPLQDYRRNVGQIVDVARRLATHPVWVRTTSVDDEQHNSRVKDFKRYARDLADVNRAADEIMTAAGVPMIDLTAFTERFGVQAFMDHVHYTGEAKARQAEYIAGWLRGFAVRGL